MSKLRWWIAGAITIAGVAGCAETTGGRARISQAAMDAPATVEDIEAELEFGRDVAARILARFLLTGDEKLAEYVSLVGNAVALHGTRPEIKFHFAVIDSDAVNAYAAPGGYIFITSAAVAQMRDEAELAAVLAHEIIHVNRRHIVKELQIRGRDTSAGAGLARVLGAAGDPTRVAFKQAVDEAISILFDKGLKHADEHEADALAVTLLATTGYDPSALKRYLERVSRQEAESLKVVSGTHPTFAARLAALDAALAEAGLAGGRYPTVQHRFQERVGRR